MDNPINYWYQKYTALKAKMDEMMEGWLKDRDGCFWDGVEEGKKAMKEQMLKEAVEGKIIFLLNGDVAVNIGDTDEYKLGQKVRIIIVKD